MSLAEAMKRHPKCFDALFCNMIAAGEAGGILDTILKRLATYIEKAVKLKGQVKAAMIYPIAVITIACLVIGVILWKVIPTFASLFAGLGAELPLPTRIVIGLSNNLVRFMPFILVGMFGIGWGFKAYYGTEKGRHVIDAITLKMPILGPILRKIAVARFCRTLSTLMASGVPILDGLDITARTAGNAIIEDAIPRRQSIAAVKRLRAVEETACSPAWVHIRVVKRPARSTHSGQDRDFYEKKSTRVKACYAARPVMIAFPGGAVAARHLRCHADLRLDQQADLMKERTLGVACVHIAFRCWSRRCCWAPR